MSQSLEEIKKTYKTDLAQAERNFEDAKQEIYLRYREATLRIYVDCLLTLLRNGFDTNFDGYKISLSDNMLSVHYGWGNHDIDVTDPLNPITSI